MNDRFLVVGVGNPDRGDDAVGWEVARSLDDVADIRLTHGEPASMIEIWRSVGGPVVIVDATSSGTRPGSVVTIDPLSEPLDPASVSGTHGMGPAEAIQLARIMDALPKWMRFVGVEAESYEPGRSLSPAVRSGANHAAELIRELMETFSSD